MKMFEAVPKMADGARRESPILEFQANEKAAIETVELGGQEQEKFKEIMLSTTVGSMEFPISADHSDFLRQVIEESDPEKLESMRKDPRMRKLMISAIQNAK